MAKICIASDSAKTCKRRPFIFVSPLQKLANLRSDFLLILLSVLFGINSSATPVNFFDTSL